MMLPSFTKLSVVILAQKFAPSCTMEAAVGKFSQAAASSSRGANQALSKSELWIPGMKYYDDQVFLQEIRSAASSSLPASSPTNEIQAATSKQSFLSSKAKEILGGWRKKPPPPKLDAEAIHIENFHKKYQLLLSDPDAAIQLVRMAVARLLRSPSIPDERMMDWVNKFNQLSFARGGSPMNLRVKVEIVYGLQSLILKNFDKPSIRRALTKQLAGLLEHLKSTGQASAGDGAAFTWGKEILNPQTGFSESFLNPPELSTLTFNSKHFEEIRTALNNGETEKAVEPVNIVFTKPTEFTSQARIASIAFSHHIVSKNPELMQKLVLFREDQWDEMLMFGNERELINFIRRGIKKRSTS